MARRSTRRSFLGGALSGLAAVAAAAAGSRRALAAQASPQEPEGSVPPRRPVVISSANGFWDDPTRRSAVAVAMERLRDPQTARKKYGLLEAVVEGVAVQEDDPNDHSVGLGGLPNEEGVVQLDSSCMFGPTHQAGSVAAIENIKNPARVAMYVLRYTDHSMLVGEGAYRFARAMGLPHTELLTDEARRIWLEWKMKMSDRDDWLGPSEGDELDVVREHGTIHLSAVDAEGNVASVTTTSGLSFKIPGRVGDSPIVGAGMYCDNEIGGAGATGRGEEAIVNCASFSVVRAMGEGREPTEACLEVMKRVADKAKVRGLFENGKPTFDLKLYAVRTDGAYGSASMLSGARFAVMDGDSERPRHEACAYLFER